MPNRLKDALERGEFVVTVELIPGHGAAEPSQVGEFEEGLRIWETGRVHAISVTDNPGGNPALLADAFAQDLADKGITPLVHITCKDRNRNQLQSQLYAMERHGIHNVLAMTGDYPVQGWHGRPRPVFDLDPVQLLQMVGDMNTGLAFQTPRTEAKEQPAHFFPGAVVSPFKYTEAETLTQYLKLRKKVAAGARFVISQLGYDARKMEELVWYMRDHALDVPVIANIYLVTAGAARLMKRGGIPGCVMSDALLAVLEEEAKAADKGKAARYLRAAKMVAIARGLGYAGVHIGGLGLTAETLTTILDTANEIQGQWQDWARELCYGQEDGWYYYRAAPPVSFPSGLNAPELTPRDEVRRDRAIQKTYGLSRFAHYWLLTQGKRGYHILKGLMSWRERKKGLHRHYGIEHTGKVLLYGCMDCGDCGLEAAIYSCPMSSCPKCQRNGPCGGSANGWCEVYPGERYCIYFKAYHRLKKHDELYKLDSFITPPNNWDFFETSGWSNYTHARDNAAHRQPLPPESSHTATTPNVQAPKRKEHQ
ncbi:MAG: methylenetetrahydrofolate reductase C-terminal domain-containing protein [Coriobacteriales bacterium]|jgi:methylenetetrahydrofolate reductase (NADPH)|nr:methylenetetrahydrofolate reductase C-terminal domain-containing protein [Coriobacteriales bacterium]